MSASRGQRPAACAAVLLAAICSLHAQPSSGRAEAIALKLQQHYEDVQNFEADFTQTISGGVLPTKSKGQGHVQVKKPGRMRWVYSKPDRQELFWDGKRFIQFFPDEKQATVFNTSATDGSAALLLLAGRGNILRDFVPSIAGAPAGSVGLKLTPRQREAGYDHIVVVLDEATLRLRSLVWRDNQGGETTTDFRNLKENGGIPDRVFVFEAPRGVEVTTAEAQRP